MERVSLGELVERLDRARSADVEAIARSIADNRVVGITGPAETGKSVLVRRAVAPIGLQGETAVVHVNLEGVYSPRQLTRRWLRALAKAAAGPIAFSHIASLPRDAWPGKTRRADHRVRDVLGSDYALAFDQVHGPRSKGGDEDIAVALGATARLVQTVRVILVIDHLEAPELSRALDVRALLWPVRELSQRERGLTVTLVGRRGAIDLASDSDGAFFGAGTWMTIEAPRAEVWREALNKWKALPAALQQTGGHVVSTLLLAQRAWETTDVGREFTELAVEQSGLAARSVQHAASVHRLGPVLLRGIANNQGPYEAIPDALTRDIAAAAQRLELAGLVHRVQRGNWRVVNPLVAQALYDPELDPDYGISTLQAQWG